MKVKEALDFFGHTEFKTMNNSFTSQGKGHGVSKTEYHTIKFAEISKFIIQRKGKTIREFHGYQFLIKDEEILNMDIITVPLFIFDNLILTNDKGNSNYQNYSEIVIKVR